MARNQPESDPSEDFKVLELKSRLEYLFSGQDPEVKQKVSRCLGSDGLELEPELGEFDPGKCECSRGLGELESWITDLVSGQGDPDPLETPLLSVPTSL